MSGSNRHREEIATLLRRAACHYGHALRDEEAGWSLERAAREHNVLTSRIGDLRRAVRSVLDGEVSRVATWADHEDAVLRALLHFRGEMSEGLRQHVDTRLIQLRAEFKLTTKVEPLRCPYGFANQSKPAPSRKCEPEPACTQCGLAHAGECW
ncbi:hypothetical protein [Nocardia nova]|uniref:Uncharacterized protein n=1 Tax=Nocardia nova TaxID=37330 RepID=A0A2S5ZZP0_9NOCA|nr:hypothetical protein [Nocardia nova]PPJ23993.1 hypothetical protein C5F51_26605 [Nocardia nova]